MKWKFHVKISNLSGKKPSQQQLCGFRKSNLLNYRSFQFFVTDASQVKLHVTQPKAYDLSHALSYKSYKYLLKEILLIYFISSKDSNSFVWTVVSRHKYNVPKLRT